MKFILSHTEQLFRQRLIIIKAVVRKFIMKDLSFKIIYVHFLIKKNQIQASYLNLCSSQIQRASAQIPCLDTEGKKCYLNLLRS